MSGALPPTAMSTPLSASPPPRHRHRPHRRPRHSPSTALPPAHSLSPAALQSAVLSSSLDPLVSHLRSSIFAPSPPSSSDAFAALLSSSAALLSLSPSPHSLALSLLSHPGMTRHRGDRVDLNVALLTALADFLPPQPFPLEVRTAAKTALGAVPLSPRAFALVVDVYEVELTAAERWAYVEAVAGRGQGREAAELAMKLGVLEEASEERHRALLMGLMKGGKGSEGIQVDTIHGYIGSLKSRPLREKWRDWTINQVAEESGGNNITVATRLLSFYHLPLSAFPRVEYLKRKHEVWWMCRMGKSDEFADVLVANDLKLQRKLIQQLAKHRYPGDLDRLHRRITQFRLHNDDDVRSTLASLASSPPPPPPPTEEADDDSTPYFSMPLDEIVWVGGDEGLDAAEAALRGLEEGAVVGLDCEFIPESLHMLGLTASHTQLLQVACATQTFLFDLQCLTREGEVCRRMVDILVGWLTFDGVKVGIGFAEDLRKLRADFPHLACFQVTVGRYADLTPLLKDPAPGEGPGSKDGELEEKKEGRGEKGRRWRVKAKAGTSPSPPPSAEDAEDDKAGDSLGLPEEDAASPSPSPPAATISAAGAAGSGGGFVPFAPKVGGLAKLCRTFVGKRLDKSCQIGLWSRRPLTAEQRMYAACDAYVQLLIYAEATKRGKSLREVDLEG